MKKQKHETKYLIKWLQLFLKDTMGKYTVYKDEKVDVKVEADLNHIVTKVISSWNSIQSIILVGGFGRGEGSVLVQNGVI
ncbi:MAG TPA: hypothetical protein EYP22_02885, partial [Methanosarcinales archaeon]|nr:hypothetical protein [Methanosarcinales archaeon]